MESLEHFVIGSVAAALALVPLAERFSIPVLLVLFAVGVVLSVLIDLDHFVLARLRVGDWRHLRRVLGDPTNALSGQGWIFEGVELERERLASHLVVGIVLVGIGAALNPAAGAFLAAVIAVHVVCDVLRDREIA